MPSKDHPKSGIAAWLDQEAAGGLLLIAAAGLALVIANSPLSGAYEAALAAKLGPMSVHHWINDGLMALFFFTIGLEVKRELTDGELSLPGSRLLPVSAAAAGMIVPALLYLAITGSGGAARGWAIPAATDIAFAQAVLLLAGRGVPPSLRLFLTTLAVIDDIGAVAIIAIGYTQAIDIVMLAAAASILAVMLILARRGVDRGWPYALLGGLLWIAVHRSGVHATVAGVLAALTIPASLGRAFEVMLHRWVALAIVPLFGFANAGLALTHLGWRDGLAPIPVGVAAGLFAGKQIGVCLGIGLPVMLGMARLPEGARPLQLYGVALLAGIGFTMSLFIGGLAFDDPHSQELVKLGVIAGSLLSALSGFVVLRISSGRRRAA